MCPPWNVVHAAILALKDYQYTTKHYSSTLHKLILHTLSSRRLFSNINRNFSYVRWKIPEGKLSLAPAKSFGMFLLLINNYVDFYDD